MREEKKNIFFKYAELPGLINVEYFIIIFVYISVAKAFNEALLILCMKYVHTKLLSSSHGMRNDTNNNKNALKCMNLMFLLSGMNALPSQFYFRKTYYVVDLDHKKISLFIRFNNIFGSFSFDCCYYIKIYCFFLSTPLLHQKSNFRYNFISNPRITIINE